MEEMSISAPSGLTGSKLEFGRLKLLNNVLMQLLISHDIKNRACKGHGCIQRVLLRLIRSGHFSKRLRMALHLFTYAIANDDMSVVEMTNNISNENEWM